MQFPVDGRRRTAFQTVCCAVRSSLEGGIELLNRACRRKRFFAFAAFAGVFAHQRVTFAPVMSDQKLNVAGFSGDALFAFPAKSANFDEQNFCQRCRFVTSTRPRTASDCQAHVGRVCGWSFQGSPIKSHPLPTWINP